MATTEVKENLLAQLMAKHDKLKVELHTISLSEYIELVKNKPSIAANAAGRVYNSIHRHGIRYELDQYALEKGKKIEIYDFFEKQFFGIQDNIGMLMQYLKSAANKSDASRRLLLFMGPVGSGKSDVVDKIKRNLAEYSNTDDGAIYRIKYPFTDEESHKYGLVKNHCPINEDPLRALPDELREDFFTATGIKIEGHLCPHCAKVLTKFLNDDISKFLSQRFLISISQRQGIGNFMPGDPKSQKASDLKGTKNISTLSQHGLSDPFSYDYSGEINYANRGIMELMEILKISKDMRMDLLSLTQEKQLKIENLPMIDVDELIISHTNESEFRKFMEDLTEEATQDRVWTIGWPYCLSYKDEEKIYQKILRQNQNRDKIHIAPHTLEVAAFYAMLTRLKPPKGSAVGLKQKIRFYAGEDVFGLNKSDLRPLRLEHTREGFEGLGPRKIVDCINRAMADQINDNTEFPCINPVTILAKIKKYLQENPEVKEESRKEWLGHIGTVLEEYNDMAEKAVAGALLADIDSRAQELFSRYIDNINNFLSEEKPRDEMGNEIPLDDELMNSIESAIGVNSSSKREFRHEIFRKHWEVTQAGGEFKWNSHDRLREAIEKYLYSKAKQTLRIQFDKHLDKAKPGKDGEKVLKAIRKRLQERGYCESCAEALIKYVNTIFVNRASKK